MKVSRPKLRWIMVSFLSCKIPGVVMHLVDNDVRYDCNYDDE